MGNGSGESSQSFSAKRPSFGKALRIVSSLFSAAAIMSVLATSTVHPAFARLPPTPLRRDKPGRQAPKVQLEDRFPQDVMAGSRPGCPAPANDRLEARLPRQPGRLSSRCHFFERE